MRAVKHILSSVAAVLLIAGLVCARVCDVSCAFIGCATPVPADAGHCHEQESERAGQEPRASGPSLPGGDPVSECQTHGLAAAETTEAGSAKVQHQKVPAADLPLAAGTGFMRTAVGRFQSRDLRSPPPRAVFSTLRI